MDIDRDKFLDEGYLIVRQVIPPDQLESVRQAYELMVDHQRAIWARNRDPDHPPGGYWEIASQPRVALQNLAHLIDETTILCVETWLFENIHSVSSALLGVSDAAPNDMLLMCSPVRDHGTTNHRGWHRDIYPPGSAPLQGYADDIIEGGPRYLQWNIPLYDDNVLWVVPGSHRRRNTATENTQIEQDPTVPLPNGIQTHLKAGDGVVYITPILHWGSRYDTTMRRTVHGGFSTHTQYPDLSFLPFLSDAHQRRFHGWTERSGRMKAHTEAALRAAMNGDAVGYRAALDLLHPGRGEKGKLLSTVYLSKVARHIHDLKRPDFSSLPQQVRDSVLQAHPITLSWGPEFAERFTIEDSQRLWDCFKAVDDGIQADTPQYSPCFQGEESRYYFEEIPAAVSVDGFIRQQ